MKEQQKLGLEGMDEKDDQLKINENKALLDLYFKVGGFQSEKRHNQILYSGYIKKECQRTGLWTQRILIITNETIDLLR